MGEFFKLLLEKILDWWPVRIIDAGCQGVLWRSNGTVSLLKPGVHFFIPKVQRIEEVNTRYRNVDCGLQSLTTRDGKEITLSINAGYRITDAPVLFTTFDDFAVTLINRIRGHAADVVSDTDYEDLREDSQGVGGEVLAVLDRELSSCGVKVEDLTADQFTKSKTFRLLQTQSY